MARLLLHNLLGSAIHVQNSVRGSDGVITGTITYNAGKFGKGAYANVSNNYIEFPQPTGYKQYKNTHELWTTLDWSANSSSVTSDGKNHHWITANFGAGNRFWFYYLNGSGLTVTYASINFSIAGVVLSAATLYHLAAVVNRHTINGTSDTIRMYRNNTLLGSSTSALATNLYADNLRILTGTTSESPDSRSVKGVIDNYKIWNYGKHDFYDRNSERAGLNDVVKAI